MLIDAERLAADIAGQQGDALQITPHFPDEWNDRTAGVGGAGNFSSVVDGECRTIIAARQNAPMLCLQLASPNHGSNFVVTGIALSVNEQRRVDIVLRVGTTQQEVSVSANALQVETTNTQLGTVIDEKNIVNLPLNGRSYIDLLSIQAGVAPSGGAGGLISVNGQRAESNSFLVNGGDVNEARRMGAPTSTRIPRARATGATRSPSCCRRRELCHLVGVHSIGPMHMAAAVGTPVVAVFGPSMPWRYSPRIPTSPPTPRTSAVAADTTRVAAVAGRASRRTSGEGRRAAASRGADRPSFASISPS
jgi:hypothetical protein